MSDVRIFVENSTGAIPNEAKARQTCQLEQNEGKFVRSSKAVATSKRQERRPLMGDVRIFEENSTGATRAKLMCDATRPQKQARAQVCEESVSQSGEQNDEFCS